MKALRPASVLLLLWGGMLYAQKVDDQKPGQPGGMRTSDRKMKAVEMHGPLRMNEPLSDTARLEWVKHFSLNRATSRDVARDVAIDAHGSVYVTGKSEGPEAGFNYLTIKYNTHGQEIWRAQYDGPIHQDDDPAAIAVDPAGNVYVTGQSMGIENDTLVSYDYATVKYNPAGQQQWAARYSFIPGLPDQAVAIAVDAGGSVYVTGESVDSLHNILSDIATIKYNPNGIEQWVRRYHDPSMSVCTPARLALDDTGNIFVAGSSAWGDGEVVRSQIVTLKYNPDGVLEWTDRIPPDSSFVEAVDIGISHSGSIYIAGHSMIYDTWYSYHGDSLLIAKYGSDGGREWLRSFSDSLGVRPRALSVDPSGNVFVAGIKIGYNWWEQGTAALIVKYSQAGDVLWTNTYVEPDHSILSVEGLGVDDEGNIALAVSADWNYRVPEVLSRSLVTMKYDASGALHWVQRLDGGINWSAGASAIAVDGTGNIVVAGTTGPTKAVDFVTLKYQPSGNPEWDARATGEGTSFESLNDMTMDAAGNLYVTGSSLGAQTSSDYVTAGFDPNGNMLWSALYNSPDSGYDYPSKIAVDRFGSVWVTGSTGKPWTYTTVRYAPDGGQLWVARETMGSGWGAGDSPLYLKADLLGNAYVVGPSGIIRYDNEGHKTWESREYVQAMTLDRHNSLYFSNDTAIVRIDSLGERQILINLPASDLAVDDTGNIFVTRCGWWPQSAHQTQKYSPSGNLVWSQNHGGEEIQLDQAGNVFVKNGQEWNADLLFKFSPGGILEWTKTAPPRWLGLAHLALDGEGCAYLSTTRASSSFGEPDFFTVKYSPSGVQNWSLQYSGPGRTAETPYATMLDGFQNIYVGGITEREGHSTDITLVKYTQLEVSVNEDQHELPLSYSLTQNYPNPFNPSTTIRFSIPVGSSSHTSLRVYDILSREVTTLVNEDKKPGNYSVTFDGSNLASGVYFYRLEAGHFVDTKKLMLIK